MLEAARTSEKLVHFYQSTQRYNPEDFVLTAVRTSDPTFVSLVYLPIAFLYVLQHQIVIIITVSPSETLDIKYT
jgi:hypothetical protein